jgi:hypothetical protein
MTQSALVIVVDEAEPVVGEQRQAHDAVAALGVPSHITILYPFPTDIDDSTVEQIGSLAASVEPFDVAFHTTGRFPEGVIFLAPEPDEPLRRMIAMSVEAFPEHPPYGGEIADPTPHLTVGMSDDADTLDDIAAEIEPGLPIRTRVDELTLLVTDDDGRWASSRHWRLGGRFDS